VPDFPSSQLSLLNVLALLRFSICRNPTPVFSFVEPARRSHSGQEVTLVRASNAGLHRARPLAKSLALRQPRRPVTGSQTPKLLPPFHCHITLRRNISLYCIAIISSLVRQTMSLFAGCQPLYLASAKLQ
jgi:hypothetical protein